jgi:hypothetical protein
MTDLKDRARALAATALACARKGDWQAASGHVQQLGSECGPDGTLYAVMGWCDTLAAKQGIDENSGPLALGWRDEDTGRFHLGGEGVPDRIRWAGQLIVARAALDEEMFWALIKALPKDPRVVGDHVGALLETVAITMNGLAAASPEGSQQS